MDDVGKPNSIFAGRILKYKRRWCQFFLIRFSWKERELSPFIVGWPNQSGAPGRLGEALSILVDNRTIVYRIDPSELRTIRGFRKVTACPELFVNVAGTRIISVAEKDDASGCKDNSMRSVGTDGSRGISSKSTRLLRYLFPPSSTNSSQKE